MRHKTFRYLFITLLIVSIFTSNFPISYAQKSTVNDFYYYFLRYDGKEHEIKLDENVHLIIYGWTDETESHISALLQIKEERLQEKEITLAVNNELNEIMIFPKNVIYLRAVPSETFSLEKVHPSDLREERTILITNENGTSIEEIKIIDNYKTVIENKGLFYFRTDENGEKIAITPEEYNSLNFSIENPGKSDGDFEKDSRITVNDTIKNYSLSKNKLTKTEQQIYQIENNQLNNNQLSIEYSTFVQNSGWITASDGKTSGTTGQARPIEAIKIWLKNQPYTGDVKYKIHMQNKGWIKEEANGDESGIPDGGLQIEAIQVSLTDTMSEYFDIYYRVHVQDYGWLDWAKNGESAGTAGLAKRIEAIEIKLVEKGKSAPGQTSKPFVVNPQVVYSAHVESIGWQKPVTNGMLSGTTGEAKRLEAVKIELKNKPYFGGIVYRSHVQNMGWQNAVSNGGVSGTTGKALQLEAIQIWLTDEMAEHYDIYYRVHVQDYGWLGWAKNGSSAGTAGLAKRIEAIEINLVEKGKSAPISPTKPFIAYPEVIYSTLIEKQGWQQSVKNGETSGTIGQSKQLEAIKISLKNMPYSGGVSYRTHVQNKGWQKDSSNGAVNGSTSEGLQLEAIQIWLTGEMANHYDIYYRTHIQDFGWLGWAKNGEYSGSEGLAKRMEAIEIILVEKGEKEPGSTDKAFLTPPTVAYETHIEYIGWTESVANGEISGFPGKAKQIEAIKIVLDNSPYSGDIAYRTHVQDYGWLDWVKNGELSGTEGKYKQVEAIQIKLEGQIAKYFDVYYRVYSQDFGWLGWAKNGMKAGSEGLAKQMEAIQIKLVRKGKGESVNEYTTFITNKGHISYVYYDITLDDAVNLQLTYSPQTDKYRNDPAYVSNKQVDYKNRGIINGSNVRLRTEPFFGNNINYTVDKNTEVIILETVSGDPYGTPSSTTWYKILYKGQELYVHSSLVNLGEKVLVALSEANVYANTDSKSHVFGVLPKGSKVQEVKRVGDWYQISFNVWRNATKSDVLYYLDPKNFLDDEKLRFQFLDLSKPSGATVEQLNNFLKGKGDLEGQGEAFITAAKTHGVNDIYLIAHAILETKHGEKAKFVYNGKTVYNMFGIGAVDHDSYNGAARTAYNNGWFTPEAAIIGGAKFIGNNYVKAGQNTLYKMRWNPAAMEINIKGGMVSPHQYATDIGWAAKQLDNMYNYYKVIGIVNPKFEIPVYKEPE